MGPCIEADGARVSKMAKGMKYGLMDRNTLENMQTVKKMDLESTHGLTRHSTMVSGVKTISMGLVFTYGKMEEATLGNGNMV